MEKSCRKVTCRSYNCVCVGVVVKERVEMGMFGYGRCLCGLILSADSD